MSNQWRILYLEDLVRWREVVSYILKCDGFLVDTAGNVEEALEMLGKEFYHLAILDIRIDEGNASDEDGGMRLLAQLNRQGNNSEMKIIMLTAYGTKEQMRNAFALYRVADFLDKADFDNVVFLNRVREILA